MFFVARARDVNARVLKSHTMRTAWPWVGVFRRCSPIVVRDPPAHATARADVYKFVLALSHALSLCFSVCVCVSQLPLLPPPHNPPHTHIHATPLLSHPPLTTPGLTLVPRARDLCVYERRLICTHCSVCVCVCIHIYCISAQRPEDGTCSKERARQTVLGTPWKGRAQILICNNAC